MITCESDAIVCEIGDPLLHRTAAYVVSEDELFMFRVLNCRTCHALPMYLTKHTHAKMHNLF
jgi:hypothetical protein